MLHDPTVAASLYSLPSFAVLCFPSRSTAPTEFTRSSEATVRLHIPESSVKPRHKPATDHFKRLPGHCMTVGLLHLSSTTQDCIV